MKACRVVLSTGKFSVAKAETIVHSVQSIIDEAQEKIKCVQDIEKFQQVYGYIKVSFDFDHANSYATRFRNNGFRIINDSIPKWTYELLYFDAYCVSSDPQSYSPALVQQASELLERTKRQQHEYESKMNKKV